MPITPFHFGPGALIKAAAPNHFSWMIFALANVVIDLEPVSLFFLIGDPVHPWLHTFPGALGVAVRSLPCLAVKAANTFCNGGAGNWPLAGRPVGWRSIP